MRSAGLVVALVLAATTASAQPVLQGPLADTCAGPRHVVPADGATGVPTNAHVWVFGGRQDGYVLVDGPTEVIASTSYWSSPPIMELRLRGLAPRRTYSVRTLAGERLTTFTTGDDVSRVPPRPPTLETVGGDGLAIRATPTDGVALWVTTRDRDRDARRWQLFPADDFASTFAACNRFAVPTAQRQCVELRSVDIAGNVSDSVTSCPPAEAGAWRPRHDTPMLILLVTLAPFAFAFVVMASRMRGRTARRRSLPRAIIARLR